VIALDVVLASALIAAVVALAASRRPLTAPSRAPVGGRTPGRPRAHHSHPSPRPASWAAIGEAWRAIERRVGYLVRARVPALRAGTLPWLGDEGLIGRTVLAGVAAGLLFNPIGGMIVAALVVAIERHRITGARRRRDEWCEAELPVAIELLRTALTGGLAIGPALGLIAPHIEGPLGWGLNEVMADVGRGRSLAESLERLPHVAGPSCAALVAALVAGSRGAPVAPAVERLATDARRRTRQRAEARARRLPVTLLFPLVLCALPAFGLLTVVPMVVAATRDLSL